MKDKLITAIRLYLTLIFASIIIGGLLGVGSFLILGPAGANELKEKLEMVIYGTQN